MTTSVLTVDPADTVHAVTKALCAKLLQQADALKMLPSTRRDLAAVVADTAPLYFNYMTFGELDSRGFERTKVTLRLDFDRVEGVRQTEVASDGARYMIQRLRVYVETSQHCYGLDALRQHVEHLQAVIAVAAGIEAQYGGRDLYLLLATAEEAREQEVQRQRGMLAHVIETECKGLRVGCFKQVVLDVATKLPGIAMPSTWPGIGVTPPTGKQLRVYDVSVGNVAITVTRTS